MTQLHASNREGNKCFIWQYALLALIVVGLINLRLTHFDRSEFGLSIRYALQCVKGVSYTPLLETFALYKLLCFMRKRVSRWPIIYVLPAAIFAFFAIEGRFFETSNAVDFFSNELFFVALSCLSCIGYLVVYYLSFVFFDYLVEHVLATHLLERFISVPVNRFVAWAERHPFGIAVVILGIMTCPLYVISYPAVFMGDTRYQLAQALGKTRLYGQHPIVIIVSINLDGMS